MLVLIVYSYDVDIASIQANKGISKEAREYQLISSKLRELFGKTGEHDIQYWERRCDQLGDIVIDWEHDHLYHAAESHCKTFDKFDFIIIVGNLDILPWDPKAMQVVSLINMAKHTNKPYLGIGFGAFSAIYSFATKGARFHILNGPEGGNISSLPLFERYSIGTGAFPSGWLDQDTGDIYTFSKTKKAWVPTCNTGIHFTSHFDQQGFQSHRTPLTAPAKFQSAKEDVSYFAPSRSSIVMHSEEELFYLSNYVPHNLLRDIPTSKKKFPVKLYDKWYLNDEGGLPHGEKLVLIGEGRLGPIAFSKDNMLFMTCRVECVGTEANLNCMMFNFIQGIVDRFRNSSSDKIELSLHALLFGGDGNALTEEQYDTFRRRRPLAEPLSKSTVPSALKNGPVKVDPPVYDMFFRLPPQASTVDYLALTGKRGRSSVGRRPKIAIQNPLNCRQKRIEMALMAVGYENSEDNKEFIRRGLDASRMNTPFAIEENMPESSKELLTGIVLRDHSITRRRKHTISGDKMAYQVLVPAPFHQHQHLQQQTSSIISRESGSMSGGGERVRFSPDPDVFGVKLTGGEIMSSTRKPFSSGLDDAEPSTARPTPQSNLASAGGVGERIGGGESNPTSRGVEGLQSASNNKSKVPKIENWVQVFQQPGPDSACMTLQSIFLSESQPKKPQSARSSSFTSPRVVSARSKTARDVLIAANSQYLPVHHPPVTMQTFKEAVKKREELILQRQASAENADDDDSGGYHDSDDTDTFVSLLPIPSTLELGNVVEVTATVTAGTQSSPRSNYKALSTKFKEMDAREDYQSVYVQEPMHPDDLLRKEYMIAKKKFVGGPFKALSTEANSVLELRQDGGGARTGPYPSKANAVAASLGAPSNDWELVQDRSSPDKWIAGPWK